MTSRTAAIVPLHLHVQPVDRDPRPDMEREHNPRVIEYASQSHGANYDGRRVRSLAHSDAGGQIEILRENSFEPALSSSWKRR